MLSGWVVFLCEIEKKMRDLARKGLTAREGRFLRVDDSTRPNPSVPELCKCAINFGRFVKF